MAIVLKDGFEFFDDLNGNPDSIILKSNYLPEAINYIKVNRLLSISLSYFLSEGIKDLNFLKEISFIEKVKVNDSMDLNFSGLYNLINLKHLILSYGNKKPDLDFSKFIKLEYLSIDWYAGFPDLTFHNNLRELIIWKFRPKSKSLGVLKLPSSLEIFQITESNILNLEGLYLENLRNFEGYYCNKLESLIGIEKFCTNIELLILDYCKKLSDYSELAKCKNLKKLILGSCGDIQNLLWLKELHNIKHFSFYETKLLDGDVSPCFGIDYVSFKNSKSYNYKKEDFIKKKKRLMKI